MKTGKLLKLAVLITAIAMLFGMASCSKSDSASDKSKDSDDSEIDELISDGEAFLDDEEYDDAVDAFKAAIKLDKKSVDAYIGLGDAYFGLEEYEDAAENYLEALDLDDESVDGYLKLAECYVELDDEDTAIQCLEDGYEITEAKKIKTRLDKLSGGDSSSPASGGSNASETASPAATTDSPKSSAAPAAPSASAAAPSASAAAPAPSVDFVGFWRYSDIILSDALLDELDDDVIDTIFEQAFDQFGSTTLELNDDWTYEIIIDGDSESGEWYTMGNKGYVDADGELLSMVLDGDELLLSFEDEGFTIVFY